MKYTSALTAVFSVLVFGLFSCGNEESEEKQPLIDLDETFPSYWYEGEAELTSYTLEQARYGELHEGHAVLIFVTEPFSRSKQVKLDRPQEASGEEKQQVMKCNFTKKFHTGIYPYSTMASIFSPVQPTENIHAVKETYSAQEWCGQTFYQLNKKNQRFNWMGFSYFESEGDHSGSFPAGWLEDELWNLIRLNPEQLPTGTVRMVPSLEYIRMAHKDLKQYKAEAELVKVGELYRYSLEYKELERALTIEFQSIFPYEIEGWTERRLSGFGEGKQMLTTTATKKHRVTLDYWNYNRVRDSTWRKKLGLQDQP